MEDEPQAGNATDAVASASKPVKKAAKKAAKKVAKKAAQKPAKKPAKKAKKVAKTAGPKAAVAQSGAAPAGTDNAQDSGGMEYGRRPKRGGVEPASGGAEARPIPIPVSAVPSPPSEPKPEDHPSSPRRDDDVGDRSDADARRGRRRRGRRGRGGRDRDGRERENTEPQITSQSPQSSPPSSSQSSGPSTKPSRSQPSRSQPQREKVAGGPQSVEEMMNETWTEERARKFLSEGFLADLSPGLLTAVDEKSSPGHAALEAPIRAIRRVLADECMVQDDATDVMLLDMVVKALQDWTQVYRLRPETETNLSDVERILNIRAKADRRLIDSIGALKSS